MFFEAKDTSVVKANALENSIAVKQTMIQNRNLRVRFWIKFSVDVDFRVLNACGRAGATFNRRFYYCLSSGPASCRLVGKNDVRIVRQSASNGNTLLFAAGKFRRQMMHPIT